MKNNILLVCLLSLISLGASAQQTIQSSNLEKFTSVELKGNLSTELIYSSTTGIEIELIDSDLTRLKWEVSGEVLKVSLKNASSQENPPRANVKIHYNQLKKVDVTGGSLRSTDAINADLFDVVCSSESIVNIAIQCLDISVLSSQNSAVQIVGTTKYLTIDASDKSKLDMRSLSAVSVNATASSLAEVFVFAQQRLVAKAKTGASIQYKGEPMILRALTSKVVKFGASVTNID